MNANLEYYKTFLVVARHKNITKASEELGISQPAVSKTIRLLEEQLGGTLFLRSQKGLTLTREGEDLYQKVNSAINILIDVENDFHKRNKLESGEIKIGISTILSKLFLKPYIIKFKKKYPNVKITIQNGLTIDLIHGLEKGTLDIVFFNNEKQKNLNLKQMKVGEVKYSIIYNRDIYSIKNIEDIKRLPFIIQRDGSFTRNVLEKFFKNYGITPNVSMEVTSHELNYDLVKAGLGIGLNYNDIVRDDCIGVFELQEENDLKNDIYLAVNTNIMQTNATKEFGKMF